MWNHTLDFKVSCQKKYILLAKSMHTATSNLEGDLHLFIHIYLHKNLNFYVF